MTSKAKPVPAMRVRDNLGELLSRAAYANERFIVQRRGKPIAVLLGLGDYEELVQKAETLDDIRAMEEVMERGDTEPFEDFLARNPHLA